MKVMLLGGNGFLGKGLQEELSHRGIDYDWVDINVNKDDKHYLDIANLEDNELATFIADRLVDVTHIVILAAKVGRKIFNKNPKKNAEYNKKIFRNIFAMLYFAKEMLNGKSFDVTFYSSSEVYGSLNSPDEILTESSPTVIKSKIKDSIKTERKYYAEQKRISEFILQNTFDSDDYISKLKILRPFNVFGKYQTKGVVFEMVESAVKNGRIWYSSDTTRSLTSADYAKRRAVDIILGDKSGVFNLTENITITMKELAQVIKGMFDYDIKLNKRKVDAVMQYRQTSKLTDDFDMNVLIKGIEDLKGYFKNGCY